jgi:hypothetical protein
MMKWMVLQSTFDRKQNIVISGHVNKWDSKRVLAHMARITDLLNNFTYQQLRLSSTRESQPGVKRLSIPGLGPLAFLIKNI